MRKYFKGDIVLVDMGDNAQGAEKTGVRPCVIISNDMMNQNSMNMVVAPLTDAKHKKIKNTDHYYLIATQMLLDPDKTNSLDKKSIIQLEDIRSVSKKRVSRHIGKLSEIDLERVNKKLPKIFFI